MRKDVSPSEPLISEGND